MAVGYDEPTDPTVEAQPMIASESGGTWGQAVPLDPPAGATYSLLEGLSCPPAGPCVAVGMSEAQAGDELPLAYDGEPPATQPAQDAGSSSVKVTTIGSPGGGAAVPTCSISLKGTSLQVTPAHAAQVKLTDTGGAACKGTVSLSIPAKAKGRKGKAKSTKAESREIGSASLQLSPGRATTVLVPLTGAGRAALARAAGGLKASLALRAATVQIAESVQLHAAKPRHGKKTRH